MIPKFRAWDKNNAYMEYTDKNLTVVFAQGGIQVVDHTTFSSSCTNMEEYVLMQSTGLLDKNGNEIFEGDILKENSMLGIVKFGRYLDYEYIQYGLDGWLFSEKLKLGFVDTPLTEYVLDPHCSIEVIGNIYEHPHLLEEE